MPTQAARGSVRPSISAIRPVKIGCVQTSAVAEATVVIVRLGTQVAKWTASATPARPAVAHVLTVSPRSSRSPRARTYDAAHPAPIVLRHKAIANAGAAVAAISGPENDTPAIATTSSKASSGGGAARLSAV
jgi:hypothetical protein